MATSEETAPSKLRSRSEKGTSSSCSRRMTSRTAEKSWSLRLRGSMQQTLPTEWKAVRMPPSCQCSRGKPVAESWAKQV